MEDLYLSRVRMFRRRQVVPKDERTPFVTQGCVTQFCVRTPTHALCMRLSMNDGAGYIDFARSHSARNGSLIHARPPSRVTSSLRSST